MNERQAVAVALMPGEAQLVQRAVRLLVEVEGDPQRLAGGVLEMLAHPPHVAELRGLMEGA